MPLWHCPNSFHPAVRGLARPRRDDVRRYCIPCSERTGRLVERTPTVTTAKKAKLEKQRAKARVKAKKRRESITQDRLDTSFKNVGNLSGLTATLQSSMRWCLVEVVHVAKRRRTRITPTRAIIYDHGFDKYDAGAHAAMAGIRWRIRNHIDGASTRAWIRDCVEQVLHVRPKLIDKLDDAEREIAELLRAEVALGIMAAAHEDGRMERNNRVAANVSRMGAHRKEIADPAKFLRPS